MTEHEEWLQTYTDPQAAIDYCMTHFEPSGPHRTVKAEVARALYEVTDTLQSRLDRVWGVIHQIEQRRVEMKGHTEHEVARQLPLAPLLELAGRLAWHSERRFADGAQQAEGKPITDEERCLFLLVLADGLKVFGDDDKERPKPPQNSCAERAKEILEIWANWVINHGLRQSAAKEASNWIKQFPSCFGHVLLRGMAERIEQGEFSRTSDCTYRRAEAMADLAYAMHKLVLETWCPFRAPTVPSQPLRIIQALAAIAEDDQQVQAAHSS